MDRLKKPRFSYKDDGVLCFMVNNSPAPSQITYLIIKLKNN